MKRCASHMVVAGLFAFGLAVPALAESGFDEFISPVSNPVNFEDPRATTEVRPIFVFHDISNDFIGLQGGEAYVAAVQARLAIGDRLSLIATKDGYVWLRPDKEIPGAVTHDDGFANIAAGLKYSLLRDEENLRIATVGLRYEAPSGDAQALQGKVFRIDGFDDRGAGILNPFVSGGAAWENFHFLGYTGVRAALDDVDSSFLDVSFHADYQIDCVYPLFEVNWVQTIADGDRLPLGGEGFDFFNLGSTNGAGKGVVTAAWGVRWRALEFDKIGVDLGSAIETPLTDREDLFGFRLTSDVIIRFL